LPDGFAVAGEVAPQDGPRTPQVWRLTAGGEVRWQRAYSDGQFVNGLAATPDGGLVLVGSTSHGPGKTNVWVVRLDPKGDVVWQRVFGAPPG
jgi:sugar lactone lactonase YvrE